MLPLNCITSPFPQPESFKLQEPCTKADVSHDTARGGKSDARPGKSHPTLESSLKEDLVELGVAFEPNQVPELLGYKEIGGSFQKLCAETVAGCKDC